MPRRQVWNDPPIFIRDHGRGEYPGNGSLPQQAEDRPDLRATHPETGKETDLIVAADCANDRLLAGVIKEDPDHAAQAIINIEKSLARGEVIDGQDVQNLPQDIVSAIALKGDDELLKIYPGRDFPAQISSMTPEQIRDERRDRFEEAARVDMSFEPGAVIEPEAEEQSAYQAQLGMMVQDYGENWRQDEDALEALAYARMEDEGIAEQESLIAVEQNLAVRSIGAEVGGAANTALMVADHASGMTLSLADWVLGFAAPLPPTGPMAEIQAQHRAEAALEEIEESMAKGDALKSEDLRALTPTHLENIRLRGDDYVRGLISDMQQENTRRQENENER